MQIDASLFFCFFSWFHMFCIPTSFTLIFVFLWQISTIWCLPPTCYKSVGKMGCLQLAFLSHSFSLSLFISTSRACHFLFFPCLSISFCIPPGQITGNATLEFTDLSKQGSPMLTEQAALISTCLQQTHSLLTASPAVSYGGTHKLSGVRECSQALEHTHQSC